jgi:tRNA threonylcarbamoyladenosine biosynthesis protein TsaB
MHLLAIETATETLSVALNINGEVLEYYQHAPRQHAELLLPWVQKILDEAGIGFNSLDAIAFSRGPGSFTSLRIGIGVVQGLAWASNVPVIPVSSLAATAQSAYNEGIRSAVIALDARMNEVFTGTFESNDDGIMMSVSQERVCAPDVVQAPPNTGFHAVGIGFERYDELEKLTDQLASVRTDIWPRASSVITLAQHWLLNNTALPAEQAQPVYLRDNVAKTTAERNAS